MDFCKDDWADRCSWGPLCHSHAIAPHATSRLCSMQALQFTFGVSLFSLHFVSVESLNSPNFDVFPCFPSKAMKSHTKQTHQANWPNFSFRRCRIFVRCVRRVTKVMWIDKSWSSAWALQNCMEGLSWVKEKPMGRSHILWLTTDPIYLGNDGWIFAWSPWTCEYLPLQDSFRQHLWSNPWWDPWLFFNHDDGIRASSFVGCLFRLVVQTGPLLLKAISGQTS